MNKKTFFIKGMHCPSCEILVNDKFSQLKNVQAVKADYKTQKAQVQFSGNLSKRDIEIIDGQLKPFGYRIVDKLDQETESLGKKIVDGASIAIILFVVYFFAQELNLIPKFNTSSGLSLFTVFVLGLVASTSTCMATSGALYLSKVGRLNKSTNLVPGIFFNFGRIVSYGTFGFVFGLIGQTISINYQLSFLLTTVVSIAMMLVGLDMLGIVQFSTLSLFSFTKDIFQKIEQPLLKNPQKTSFFLGAGTYLLPCGFTQAVQLYALGLASPVKSSITMMIFALGTTPVLMAIGYLSTLTQSRHYRVFQKAIAVLIIMIGVFSLSNFLPKKQTVANKTNIQIENGVQVVRMDVDSSGYSPSFFTVKKGIPVRWLINGKNVYGCQAAFIVPALGIQKTLEPGENVIKFTANKIGTIGFSCSMGMYRGEIEVI